MREKEKRRKKKREREREREGGGEERNLSNGGTKFILEDITHPFRLTQFSSLANRP